MASLHDVTEKTKVVAKWVAISIPIILILFFSIRFAVTTISQILNKPKPPTVGFKELPQIEFPQNAAEERLTYTLDTVQEQLPYFGYEVEVFKIINNELKLNDLERAKSKVAGIGFKDQEIPIIDNLYRWDQPESIPKSIEMDIVTGNFKLRSNYFTNPTILEALGLDQDSAEKAALNFLTSVGSHPDDLDPSPTSKLLIIRGRTLIPATSIGAVQIVRVNFSQNAIQNEAGDSIPIMYPNPPFSTINLLVASGGKNQKPQVVEADFYHHLISDKSETYPLKTTEKAWEVLKNGNAYIAARFGTDSDIKIQKIYLGYYAGDKKQDYLTPIFVFEGQNSSFFAYVPAVDDEQTAALLNGN